MYEKTLLQNESRDLSKLYPEFLNSNRYNYPVSCYRAGDSDDSKKYHISIESKQELLIKNIAKDLLSSVDFPYTVAKITEELNQTEEVSTYVLTIEGEENMLKFKRILSIADKFFNKGKENSEHLEIPQLKRPYPELLVDPRELKERAKYYNNYYSKN